MGCAPRIAHRGTERWPSPGTSCIQRRRDGGGVARPNRLRTCGASEYRLSEFIELLPYRGGLSEGSMHYIWAGQGGG